MAKKVNFDNTVKKMEGLSDKINILMRNKLIIAIFLIVDGITFVLNPNSSLAEMSRAIIILVLLASLSTLFANLSVKPRDIKSIIISLIIIILGIVLYIYPDLISAYIQLILSLFIIGNGLMNIVNSLNLNKASKYTKFIAEKYNKIINKKKENKDLNEEKKEEKFKDVNKNFNEGMEQQKERLIAPLERLVGKTSDLPVLYIVANVATVILGIILLIFPDVSMVIWGIIFLYIGLSDLIVSMKTMNISKNFKEKFLKK